MVKKPLLIGGRDTGTAPTPPKPVDKYEQLAAQARQLAEDMKKTAAEASAAVASAQSAREIREAQTRARKAEAARQEADRAATAARMEQIRQAATQRTQDAAKRGKTEVSRDTFAFNQVMKAARARAGTITDAGLKTKAGVENVLDTWAAQNDKLYSKGNFLTVNEKADLLKEVQKNPYLAYDVMTGTKPEKPPKTLDEALARMSYLVSEVALGGAREVALPMSLKAGEPRRVEDAILQVVGGLLTPSPADFAISQAFRNLAKLGKKGSRIIRKVTQGAELTPDEARQFEKLVGQYGYSTSDLRKAGTKLDDLTNTEWDELLKKYQKYYEFWEKNPDLYGAGAAYKPSALLEFEDLLDDLDYDAGEYIDYLKKYKVDPTMNPATLIAFINGVPPPKADLKAYEKIESDLEKYRESLKQKLKEATEEAVITGPVSRTGPKQPDPTKPGYTPKPTPPKEEQEEPPKPIPPKVIQEEPPKPIPPKVIQEGPPKPIPPKMDEEESPPLPPPDEPTMPLKPRGKDGRMRPNVFRALVGGLKEKYKVVFDYPKGKGESFTVTSRSFPQALSQATQLRRVKYVPSEVDVAKVGK